MDQSEEEDAAPAADGEVTGCCLPLPRELMIQVLCFLIPATRRFSSPHKDEHANKEEMTCCHEPTLDDGVRWVFQGALVCRGWHRSLTSIDPFTGRPRCPELWRQLAFACGFWGADDPLPKTIDQDREDWRQFFINEYQQSWVWSATHQVGKIGSSLREAQFLLSENGSKATLHVNVGNDWEDGYACGAILTEREITGRRSTIRVRATKKLGFFTLGVCTGSSPPEVNYRKNFASFIEWDNMMISYDVTGKVTNRYHRDANLPGFGNGDEIEAHVEGDTLWFFRNGKEVGATKLGALPQPWHFYWASNCNGSAAHILRRTTKNKQVN